MYRKMLHGDDHKRIQGVKNQSFYRKADKMPYIDYVIASTFLFNGLDCRSLSS